MEGVADVSGNNVEVMTIGGVVTEAGGLRETTSGATVPTFFVSGDTDEVEMDAEVDDDNVVGAAVFVGFIVVVGVGVVTFFSETGGLVVGFCLVAFDLKESGLGVALEGVSAYTELSVVGAALILFTISSSSESLTLRFANSLCSNTNCKNCMKLCVDVFGGKVVSIMISSTGGLVFSNGGVADFTFSVVVSIRLGGIVVFISSS